MCAGKILSLFRFKSKLMMLYYGFVGLLWGNYYESVNPTITWGKRTKKDDQILTEPYPCLTEGSSVLLTIIT